MSEVIRVRDQYYILATSPLAVVQTRVLKQGETFGIFDTYGDVRGLGRGEQGLYHRGTRYLSESVLTLSGERPLLLDSSVEEDNVLFSVDLTNPDMTIGDVFVPRGSLHVLRTLFLWEGVLHQRLRLHSYAPTSLEVTFTLTFESDFADIFEVRGVERSRRGTLHPAEVSEGALCMRYEGLDGVERATRVSSFEEGAVSGKAEIHFSSTVDSHETRELFCAIACEEADVRPPAQTYPTALGRRRKAGERIEGAQAEIETSSELFDAWVHRSLADLRMMITNTSHGPIPYGGVPWFVAPFGRDALITAFEMLWVDPGLARGVLSYLAQTQATHVDPEREAEPGKIIHEQRNGELAALGEVPFGSYYGSVDSTPLFVALAGEYFSSTADVEFMRSIWPSIEAALGWLKTYGDADGDGFVEYRGSERGLVQQGWKDSHDSVFHADGSDALPPIALCEVQGYVYWAKRSAARVCRALGNDARASELDGEAEALREAFAEAFWLEDLGTYALALDGAKRPCAVSASNAGHCLTSGIALPEHAVALASTLMSERMFSGWGVRTLGSSESRYGPITYHNGSIWPHDNALIAYGLSAYGFPEAVHRIMEGLLDASTVIEFHRLPELYCGFPRRRGHGPVAYPLACAPQAWASGAPFLLLRACLGLSVDATQGRVVFHRPILPAFLQEVSIRGLQAGNAGSVDLELRYHHAQDVGVNVVKRTGDVEVVTIK